MTSLAVVYAALVETGLDRFIHGKEITSATFVMDILTVIGSSLLFIILIWIVPFAGVLRRSIWGTSRFAPRSRRARSASDIAWRPAASLAVALMNLGTEAASQAAPSASRSASRSAGTATRATATSRSGTVVAFAFCTLFLKAGSGRSRRSG